MNKKEFLDFISNPANKRAGAIWARQCGKTQLKIDLLKRMNTKIYDLIYDCQLIARVSIEDSAETRDIIKQMVEFWGNWEFRLGDNGGDYTKTFLKQLVGHILNSGGAPDKDEEGWVPLDGSFGIKFINCNQYEFYNDLIGIEEVK